MTASPVPAYRQHLQSSNDLITTYAATRAGFVALALEKSRQAIPHIAQAKALRDAIEGANLPSDIRNIDGIQAGLLAAAGLSEKSLAYLLPEDRAEAIDRLIETYLEPAGDKFREELVYRFLLTKGDTLGGSMRNMGGLLAQRKLVRAILAMFNIAGITYQWLHAKTKQWVDPTDDPEIEMALRGLYWTLHDKHRMLLFNLTVPLIRNNVDLVLLNLDANDVRSSAHRTPASYIALGELKGGIDPAGADEHWKTALAALNRIRDAFSTVDQTPQIFLVAAAIEKKMATEIWSNLESGRLSNAANLTEDHQIASIVRWLGAL